MREIKFRAWDGRKKIMITSDMLSPRFISLSGKSMYIESERMSCFGGGYDLKNQHFDDLMQFTGLKDKNGVEIYEGDLVSDHVGIGIVTYSDKRRAFRVIYSDGRAKWFIDYNLIGELESIEIIGNAHQNPDLLEL